MKRILSLALVVIMIMAVLCGCNQEFTAKVEKNGKTKITVFSAIPVETVEAMGGAEELGIEDVEDMKIEKVDGVECYVEKQTEKFSSIKKANEFMAENFGEEAGGYFKTFKIAKNKFEAKLIEGTKDAMVIYGDSMTVKVAITLPYTVTKTNGKLSKDKKTVTFDISKTEKLYAYTKDAMYINKAYLKTKSSAFISWNKLDSAKKYKVSYKAIGTDDWKSFETTKTSATVKKLEEGNVYTFKVTALLKNGKTSSSFESQVVVLKKVNAKVVSKTKKAVELEWNMNFNADGYIVYKKLSGAKKWTKVKTIKDCYGCWYSVKNLEPGTKYDFKVVAFAKENGKRIEFTGATVTAQTK